MKSLKEIEKMSFEQLEEIADGRSAERIEVPGELKESVEAAITASSISSPETSSKEPKHYGKYSLWAALSAAAVAAAVVAGIVLYSPREPLTDTFDDPYLAYAEVESVFEYMSSKMEKGRSSLEEIDSTADKVMEILKKL